MHLFLEAMQNTNLLVVDGLIVIIFEKFTWIRFHSLLLGIVFHLCLFS